MFKVSDQEMRGLVVSSSSSSEDNVNRQERGRMEQVVVIISYII